MNAERIKAAREALCHMDDYARMAGIDPIGPRKVLVDFITEAERATQPAQDRCCEHDSDCAIHNAPAYPVGPCDCTLSEKPVQEPVAAARAVPEVIEDPITVPRGLIGAACYLIRKHAPDSKLLEKLRAFTLERHEAAAPAFPQPELSVIEEPKQLENT